MMSFVNDGAPAADVKGTPLRPGLEPLDDRISRAAEALLARQKADGHWVFELEADATIPSEYVLLRHYLGEPDDLELERKIGVYLRRIQGEHGGWPLFEGGAFDISASVKAYFALKMIGDDPEALHMARAREAIRAHGGAQATNVLTRFLLALYGETPWSDLPAMPVELMIAPKWFPIQLSKISYWARTTIVPMLVLQAKKPRARNRRGVRIAELYAHVTPAKRVSQAAERSAAWTLFFNLLDVALKLIEPFWPKPVRARATRLAVGWVTERLNGVDGLGAIYPAMANTVMMYDALGYPPEHPLRAQAREALERLLIIKEGEAYCQPCVSPIWDTALAAHALLECGDAAGGDAAERALDWLAPRQILEVQGDWAVQRPNLRPGGWAFQYNNDHYPDVDDTSVVAMAMDRLRRLTGTTRWDKAIDRGVEWIEGVQSQGGGWGAFDADNANFHLNNIPFADHGALLDPPTEDVTARCVSLLAQLSHGARTPTLDSAIDYLERTQLPDGSWFGRWGVNYIYGTWSALCALNAAGLDAGHPMVGKAADWLKAIQNPDGGWGEDCDSYRLDYDGYKPFRSVASQTAWALMGLMAAGLAHDPAVTRGVDYLIRHQDEEGFWDEPAYTGGGFPRVFYLRYHGYSKFFPLWALARYRTLIRGNSLRPGFGM
jgi:squalene-hopene/tetraprenyl-beta-curcumene cyclase